MMEIPKNPKTWQVMSLFLLGMWCTSLAVASAEEVSWLHGEIPPPSTWNWNISPDNLVNTDIIHFSDPIRNREIYDNSCLAEQAMGGTPSLTINAVSKNIELRFEPPAPESCPPEYDPVCGLEGSFGPLEEGEWTFWACFPGRVSFFSFQVGSIHYVDANATGANDGTSWNNAYKYLQDALADAASCDQIWVAEGVYNPDCNLNNPSGTGDREATFQLISGGTIKGGYAGFGAPDSNARDIEIYKTILSGDLDDNDVGDFNDPSRDENSHHVVTGSGTNNTTVLDGFTITAGNADGSSPNNKGGGMYNNSGSPTISNCTLSMNFAEQSGGAVWNNDHSDPTLTNCTISDNMAGSNGGGIYNDDYSDPMLNNCTISNNMAGNNGGGICNEHLSHSNISLINCIICKNTTINDGGGIYSSYADVTLTSCTTNNNTASNNGGGIWNRGDLTGINSIFAGNSAEYGGGIYNWECGTTLTNCTFTKNSASIGNAAAYDSVMGNYQVTNCILWDGGSEIWHNASLSISVTYSDVQGGWEGLGNIDTDPCFANPDANDFHLKSQAGRWDPNLFSGSDFTDDGIVNLIDFSRFANSWFSQGQGLAADLNRDEIVDMADLRTFAGQFLTPGDKGGWVLDSVTSNCIDAGNPSCPPGSEPSPNGNRINMGAYGGMAEASKSPLNRALLADMTNDHIVDFNDLEVFVSYWLNNGQCIPSDLSHDGAVDLLDFAIIADDCLYELVKLK